MWQIKSQSDESQNSLQVIECLLRVAVVPAKRVERRHTANELILLMFNPTI